MAYTMNSPYKDVPAMPSKAYLEGILNGCRQNGSEITPVLEAVWLTQRNCRRKQFRRKNTIAGKAAKNDNLNTGPRGLRALSQPAGAFFYFV